MSKTILRIAVLGFVLIGFSFVPRQIDKHLGDAVNDPVAMASDEKGKALFSAEGCIGCHQHAAIDSQGTVNVGSNLTRISLDPRIPACMAR